VGVPEGRIPLEERWIRLRGGDDMLAWLESSLQMLRRRFRLTDRSVVLRQDPLVLALILFLLWLLLTGRRIVIQ
jgi:hypothetical protein